MMILKKWETHETNISQTMDRSIHIGYSTNSANSLMQTSKETLKKSADCWENTGFTDSTEF